MEYTRDLVLSGDLKEDITSFFKLNHDIRTLQHTLEVAEEAERIAKLYGLESEKMVCAAFLHDISNVVPVSSMIQISKTLSIEVLEQELTYDRSVHQKLSRYMAEDIFGITDDEILGAIESHTTHKPHANMTDKILFVSDKISWKLPGEHLYLQEMRSKVDRLEIDEAILIYLNYIWGQRDKLKLVHPWLISAREELIADTL
ncbi:bis(5'-nucleosyl)-tetraphosphatase (symmetrical) YqeK [Paenibacillus sp. Sa2BVA9]|uniref:bis(5'-nucleosyl)-tetraphosphatase (symmetrical) n=2 Tax=Paenibacillus gallinarum TaxID=2762232 RepID=A0ABR8ST96_9BACL|nr:bis(5'-nucleosyl)-tetraphosphatase (symmetrical) YqeK [Paenibacillus gallinarum]